MKNANNTFSKFTVYTLLFGVSNSFTNSLARNAKAINKKSDISFDDRYIKKPKKCLIKLIQTVKSCIVVQDYDKEDGRLPVQPHVDCILLCLNIGLGN